MKFVPNAVSSLIGLALKLLLNQEETLEVFLARIERINENAVRMQNKLFAFILNILIIIIFFLNSH